MRATAPCGPSASAVGRSTRSRRATLRRYARERLKATKRATEGKAGHQKTVTPATVNREVAFLRHVFNVAIRDGKTERNPVTRLRFFQERGRVRYLTDEEAPKLMAALATDGSGSVPPDRLATHRTPQGRVSRAPLATRGFQGRRPDGTAPKNGQARHVPMNATVREILGRRPRSLNRDALVFPNSAGMVDLRWAEKAFPGACQRRSDRRFQAPRPSPYLRVASRHGRRGSPDGQGTRRVEIAGDGPAVRAPVARASAERRRALGEPPGDVEPWRRGRCRVAP